ncbi:MAG: cation:proton antiporter [Capsulimonadales bacterium]|nr:cation:proton antiporter [Capsulimonadales bacterium]
MNGHSGTEFLTQIGIVLGAALLSGLAARALGLPVLIGYLLAGLLVGPHTPGVVADRAVLGTVADLGVALLMFTVGVRFSLQELNQVRRIALVGGTTQIAGTAVLGVLLGLLFGWGAYAGLFLGCALALSSTAVVLKILEERGEQGTTHGHILLGLLVVQDLSLVLMIVLLPALAALSTEGVTALVDVGIALLKAALFLAGTILLATRGVPGLFDRVARTGSRELFLLTVVSLCLAASVAAERLGLGLLLGAFLAGIVVSESGFAQEVFTQVRPLRDVFAALFFVSVGMLLDPGFLAGNALPIGAVVLTILVGKTLVTVLPLRYLGLPGRTIVRTGLGLAQIGEFSFVLASVGAAGGLIAQEIGNIILSAALVTILLTPFVYGSADPVYQSLLRVPRLQRWLNGPTPTVERSDSPAAVCGPDASRVVILGAGRVGRYVSDALRAHDILHTVIDYDGNALERLRDNAATIYGDATSEIVLEQTAPECAELAIIALPDADSTEIALRQIKRMAPSLPVVVRVHRGIDIPRMRKAGADTVIHAEFEAGTEMIRQGLDRLGIRDPEVDAYIGAVRERRYREG